MVNFTILAGSFSTFISAFSFVPGGTVGGKGTLSLISQSPAGKAPSWIQRSPFNASVLYAVDNVADGRLSSFTVGAQGRLTLAATTSSGGDGPSHLLPLRAQKEVAVMNTRSGTGLVVPLRNDLLNFATNPGLPLIVFQKRVRNPTPHQTLEVGNQLFVPDDGSNTVWRLNKTAAGPWMVTSFIDSQPVGALLTGPRRIAVADGILYILHQEMSNLTSQKIPPNVEKSSAFIGTSTTTPPNVQARNYVAGEIRISAQTKEFPERFIYVSSRKVRGGQDPLGDSIAIFRLGQNGNFTFVKHVHTKLQNLLSFAIDPSGRYLVAGGNTAGGIKVFERILGGADLVQVAHNKQVQTASSFVWLL